MPQLGYYPPRVSPKRSDKLGRRKRSYGYRPLFLRPKILVPLLLLTFVLVSILEYAAIKLPHSSLSLSEVKSGLRNISATIHEHNVVAHDRPRSQPKITRAGLEKSLLWNFAQVNRDVASDSDGPSSSTPKASSSTPRASSAAAPSAFVQTESTAPGSAFVQTESTATSMTSPGAFVQTSGTVIASATQSVFVQTSTNKAATTRGQTQIVSGATIKQGSVTPPTHTSAYLETTHRTEDTSLANPKQSQVSGRPQSSTAFLTSPARPAQTTARNGTICSGVASPLHSGATLPVNANLGVYPWWTAADVFVGFYLATLVAVFYRLSWSVIYYSFSLMEPFRLLSQEAGASADLVLFKFWQSQPSTLGMLPALWNKRWSLALVSIASVLTELLPAFASQSIFVDTNWNCPSPYVHNKHNPCPPRIEVDLGVLRIMQVILAFAAAVILFLIALHFYDNNNVPHDPRAVATIAGLMRSNDLLEDFDQVPANATVREMRRMFRGKRYRLDSVPNGGTGCGIVPVEQNRPIGSGRAHEYQEVGTQHRFLARRTPTLQRVRVLDGVLVFLLLGLFAVCLGYHFAAGRSGFNDFFNSDTFGPRFILTLAATVIASLWKSAEQSAMSNAPFQRMAKRPSSAETTILFKPSLIPISSTTRALRHGYYFVGSLTIVTLLADIGLNTVISGVPYAPGQVELQSIAATWSSIAMLCIMLLVSFALIVSRFSEVPLPRRPDTLGAVMSYLSNSRLVDYCEGTQYLDEASRDSYIQSMHQEYELSESLAERSKLAWTINTGTE